MLPKIGESGRVERSRAEREKGGGGETRRKGKREKRRKSNYSAGIIINSQLVPRNYSFEGHAAGGGEVRGTKKRKKTAVSLKN